MKVFLDANVLFAAAWNPAGAPAFLISLASDGLSLVTSESVVCEAQINLSAKRPASVPILESLIEKIVLVPTRSDGDALDLPPKDAHVFRSAVHAQCTHLITGDTQHFGKWMNLPEKTEAVLIQTVREFLSSL